MKLKLVGLAAIVLSIAFNIPYSLLAANFSYPDILRRPAEMVLAAYTAGGPSLVLTWYAFMLCAMALIPFAIIHAFATPGAGNRPATANGAAIFGALAGLTQAIGLSRWVFVVPTLAAVHADPSATPIAKAAATAIFDMLNAWGGVAIGEHLGQMLTIFWVLFAALPQARSPRIIDRIATVFAAATIFGIGFGLGEGLALALGTAGDIFSLGTITGYLAFSGWLFTAGLGLILNRG